MRKPFLKVWESGRNLRSSRAKVFPLAKLCGVLKLGVERLEVRGELNSWLKRFVGAAGKRVGIVLGTRQHHLTVGRCGFK